MSPPASAARSCTPPAGHPGDAGRACPMQPAPCRGHRAHGTGGTQRSALPAHPSPRPPTRGGRQVPGAVDDMARGRGGQTIPPHRSRVRPVGACPELQTPPRGTPTAAVYWRHRPARLRHLWGRGTATDRCSLCGARLGVENTARVVAARVPLVLERIQVAQVKRAARKTEQSALDTDRARA
jgi:hypothetical protein